MHMDIERRTASMGTYRRSLITATVVALVVGLA
jgi:hypothetical protein